MTEQPRRRKRDTSLTVKDKLDIVKQAERSTVRGTASKYGVQPSQIRRWRKTQERLEQTAKRNPKAKTVSMGRPLLHAAFEAEVAAWIRSRRELDIAVSTRHVINKALSMDPSFKGGNRKTLRHWVYPFLRRNRLSIRRRTHVGQKLSGHLQSIRKEFVDMVNERFQPGGTLEGTPPSMIVNMDETSVHYEPTAVTTIAPTNSRTVVICGSGSNSQRLTACITCAQDGTKLPLFVVFKAMPHGHIENKLDKILPPGVYGCCQESGWMDDRGCRIWAEKVWAPYVAARPSSMLLLDEFKCHKQPVFGRQLSDLGTDLTIIPGGYTCVLQPCDVGLNKPLKDAIRAQYDDWASENMAGVAPDANVPVPKREDIVSWLLKAWQGITEQSVRDTFTSIGFGVTQVPDVMVLRESDGDDEIEEDSDDDCEGEGSDSDVLQYISL